jgi:hypothetical protein
MSTRFASGSRSRRRIGRLLSRARRKLAFVRVRARQRALVADQPVVLAYHDTRWTWMRDYPRASRGQLRVEHLARVLEVLRAAKVAAFLVPDPADVRHQLGVRSEDWSRALGAVKAALRGQAWYAEAQGRRWLIDELPADHDDALILHPAYRVAGTPTAAGRELGVPLIPWRRLGDVYEPARRNPQAGRLRPEDLDEVEVERHGRAWPLPSALATPHVDEVAPLRWVVHVPADLRREAPALAEFLGRSAARSLWFHGLGVADITVLDGARPDWCRGPGAPEVVVRDGSGDETAALVGLWTAGPGPLAVLPAGGLLLRDLPAIAMATPGGVTTFAIDATWLDERSERQPTPRLREARRVRAWFEHRTGRRVHWLASHAPYALPPLDGDRRADLERLLTDPERPRTARGGTAALLPVWWAHQQGAAVPGRLAVAHLEPASDRYENVVTRLVGGEGRAAAVSVDPDELADGHGRVASVERLLAHRLPVAAPWETDRR